MAVDLLDGPLLLEARHRWFKLDGTLLATLGLLEDDPCYKLTDITGLLDIVIQDVSEPKTQAVGDRSYPSRVQPRNATYELTVCASTQQLMRRGATALRAAFGPDVVTGLAEDRLMRITPHPDYGTAEHAFVARCLQVVPGSAVQETGPGAMIMLGDGSYALRPHQYSHVIGLKLDDPHIFEWNDDAELGIENPKW